MKSILIFILLLSSFQSFSAEEKDGVDQLVDDSKSDLMIVVGGGLAGAVLGLSTLSFVDEPKDHTKNILMGASIGIIAGVIFVIYNQANNSQTLMFPPAEEAFVNKGDFDTVARDSWHSNNMNALGSNLSSANTFNYTFSY